MAGPGPPGVSQFRGTDKTDYRVVLIGEGGVGKTSLTMQFVHARFVDDYDPTLEDTYRKRCVIDGENTCLEILDSAGQEDYSIFKEKYLNRGDAFLLVFAINSQSSFENISRLYQQILRVKNVENFPVLLVGNKTDLEGERQVSNQEAKELAASMNCPYVETSAKLRHNIEEVFFNVVRETGRYRNIQRRKSGSNKPLNCCTQ